jgi:ribonuclease HI
MDLWRELSELDDLHLIVWTHVRGHSGNKYNERCDYLAELARSQMVLDDLQSQINAAYYSDFEPQPTA